MIILTRGLDSIVLPSPQFGNIEQLTTGLNVRYDMSGLPRTLKKPLKYRLVYSFQYAQCSTDLVTQLNTFLQDLGTITLTDHKGKDWNVACINNPIIWNQATRQIATFTLEFEGEPSA